jgi:hypothetical protein
LPPPLQTPVVPQLAAPWLVQLPVGSPPPPGTFWQLPCIGASAQVWQDGQVPISQQ